MVKPPYYDSTGIKKGAWSEEEDFMLRSHIDEFGHQNWRLVPILAGLDRCGKSCRLRWVNYLKPGLRRGNFTAEEEDLIFRLHAQLGNKWSSIAKHLPGRTDNEVKNHWHAHLKKCRIRQTRAAKVLLPHDQSSEPSSSCITSSDDDHHQQNEVFSTARKPQDMNSAVSQIPPHHYYCGVDPFTAAGAVNQAHFNYDMLQFAEDDNGQIYWENMDTLIYNELLMQNPVKNDSLNNCCGYASDGATGVTSSTVETLNSEGFIFGEDSLWC